MKGVRRWALRVVIGRDVRSDDLVAMACALFHRFAQACAIVLLPSFLTSGAPSAVRATGAVALLVLIGWWAVGHRREEFPHWALPLEGAALAAVAVAIDHPFMALGVYYGSIYFRALYAPGAGAAMLWAAYLGSHMLSLPIAGLIRPSMPVEGMLSPGALQQVPGFALAIVAMRVLAAVAARREVAARRHAALAEAGRGLAVARTRQDVTAVVADAASALLGEAAQQEPVVVCWSGENPVVGSTDEVRTATGAEWTSLPQELRATWQAGVPAVLGADAATRLGAGVAESAAVPIAVDGQVHGLVIIPDGDADTLVAVESLAGQAALSLQRLHALEELQASEARFSALVANATDVIRVVDAQGTILHESPAVERVLGHLPETIIGRSAFDLVHPDDVGDVRDRFEAMLAAPAGPVTMDIRQRHQDGSWRLTEVTGVNLLGDPAVQGFVINYRDITDRARYEEQLRHQALHDPLTGLPNRTLFSERVQDALAAVKSGGSPSIAVIFVDLDDFKTINDALGHTIGDTVLRSAAARLQRSVRPSDTCARLGGDEFAVLVEDVRDADGACAVGQRILESLLDDVDPDGQAVRIQASIGIVVSDGSHTADELIRNADLAMYRAKGTGKGRVDVFEDAMHEIVHARLLLKSDIERGLAAGEFVPHYQPIVDLQSGSVVACEALVRWHHPQRGLLAPGEFIELAEETGLIVPMGRAVLHQACRFAAGWPSPEGLARPAPQINVNLSASELQQPDLLDHVAAVLADTGLSPARLVIEITEGGLLTDPHRVATTLARLRAMGVRIALDDFGTGYSSLAHLHRYTVDMLKIDKTFVDRLGTPEESPLADAILGLSRALKLRVTAEGVEEPAQVERLQQLGCRFAQGYAFGRPQPEQETTAVLAASAMVSTSHLPRHAQHDARPHPHATTVSARELREPPRPPCVKTTASTPSPAAVTL